MIAANAGGRHPTLRSEKGICQHFQSSRSGNAGPNSEALGFSNRKPIDRLAPDSQDLQIDEWLCHAPRGTWQSQ